MPTPDAPTPRSGWLTLLIVVLLIGASTTVYYNSLSAPFLFDDLPAISGNPSIKRLWPLSLPLSPPPGTAGADGRPIVNLSLALNYAWSGFDVRGYHIFNVALHTLVGLLLYAFMRRTLNLGATPARLREHASLLAGLTAAIWLVHPLLTESVTCVVQRNELLIACFLLLMLHSLARAAGSLGAWPWLLISVVCCGLGMASKEVMVGAPIIAFFYDRAFLTGSFAETWRRRRTYYLGTVSTWLLLAWLVLHAERRSGTAGFGLSIGPWEYLLTQCRALVLYLKLAVYPHPLVADYGSPTVHHLVDVWPHALFLVLLVALTVWALRRHPRAGWLGLCFFTLLAPSSSIVPLVTQTIAEHRMYLPLAVLVAGSLLLLFRFGGHRATWAAAVTIPVFAALSIQRNRDYQSSLALWSDTVAKAPGNPRAHNNLGSALVELGRLDEAIAAFRTALRLQPDHLESLNNLGNALLLLRPPQVDEALRAYEAALAADPSYATAHSNFGNALISLPGRLDDAIAHLQTALRLRPVYPEAHFNLGLAYLRRPDGAPLALAEFEAALRDDPDSADAHYQRATLLLREPARRNEAIAGFETALRLRPAFPQAHHNLATALAQDPARLGEAIEHLRAAARLKPDYFSAYYNLGLLYLRVPGGNAEARRQLERAVALQPDSEPAREALAYARSLP